MRFAKISPIFFLAISLSAQGQQLTGKEAQSSGSSLIVKDLFGDSHTISDTDGDGWDDLWCSLHNIKHRDKNRDFDGDGLTDYQEMVLQRDPLTPGPYPEKVSEEEIAAAKLAAENAKLEKIEKAEREWPATLAALGPNVRTGFDADQPDPDFIRPDNAEWQENLNAEIASAQADAPAVQAELERIADFHNIPLSGTDEQRREWVLAGEDENGHPIIVSNQNAQAADAINADDLWPAFTPGVPLFAWQNLSNSRNLTGHGVITSAFDAGNGARETHQEFQGRVIPKNRLNGSGSNHPTAVADVIAGGGILNVFRNSTNYGKMLKGVAYESTVHSYSLSNFGSKLLETINNGVRFSNHSYSIAGGWQIAGYNGQNRWYWKYPDFPEDPVLGNYYHYTADGIGSGQIDDRVRTSKIHLPIICAGNANGFGPGTAVTYVQGGGNPGLSTATRPWVNGDAGGYDTLLAPGTAKNVLTVGSIKDVVGGVVEVSDFSGTGPADDGRIKPDFVAVGERNPLLGKGNSLFLANALSDTSYYNGITADSDGYKDMEGTSFATPQVTGGLALALQRRNQLFPNASPALASTWRALAIATAQDIGSPGPDFKCGWGIFDALGVVQALEADAQNGRGSMIKEFDIEPEISKPFYVTLPANTSARATLAWTDVPRSRGTGAPLWNPYLDDYMYPELINDMGLLIEEVNGETPTGTFHYPWILNPSMVTESASERSAPAVNTVVNGVIPKDNRNNVERIDISALNRPRRFKVTVSPDSLLWGQVVGSFFRRENQPVSVVLMGFEPEAPQGGAITYLDTYYPGPRFAYNFTTDPGSFYTVETSTTLEAGSWTNVDVGTFKAETNQSTFILVGYFSDTKRFWRAKRIITNP